MNVAALHSSSKSHSDNCPECGATAEVVHARVAKGAAWMDENCPDWFNEIDLDKLRMQDGSRCILGQTSACLLDSRSKAGLLPEGVFVEEDYNDGFWAVLCAYGLAERTFAGDHGFDLPANMNYFPSVTYYEMLKIAWSEYVRERRIAQEPK